MGHYIYTEIETVDSKGNDNWSNEHTSITKTVKLGPVGLNT